MSRLTERSVPGALDRVPALGAGRWMLAGAISVLLGYLFRDGIAELVRVWESSDEYSHGYFVPLVSLYLAWMQRDALFAEPTRGSWWGVAATGAGLALLMVGELSAVYSIVQYALVATIVGLTLAIGGWRIVRILWAPLVFLLFAVPLPPFVYQKLSSMLQLLSSQIGVEVIRLFGISVLLEGNMIDLGTYRLQVAEACSGLRYLFPLLSFAFLCAYLFRAPLWQRLVVFLSAIPITVLMNSLRIGVIGVLVEHFGTAQAEGFLHDFEGWVIFVICVGLLLLEFWGLARLRGDRTPLREMFVVGVPETGRADLRAASGWLSVQTVAALALLLGMAVASAAVGDRRELQPVRDSLASFPMELGDWRGRHEQVAPNVLRALQVDDYLFANFHDGQQSWMNLYVAWHASQRKGQASHSPRACIPGGGWRIEGISRFSVPGAAMSGTSLGVNRVRITKGDMRQLVYYWFAQRGRNLTNEYAVKGYLLLDAIRANRTDGALVRVTTPLGHGESWDDADSRLAAFTALATQRLESFIPD